MTTHVMFGKTGLKSRAATSPVQHRKPLAQANESQKTKTPATKPCEGRDNLNEIDFGCTFSAPYAEDSSMVMIFVLWLFFGGIGMHRFYMGHKWVGTMIAALGTFNGMMFFTAGLHAIIAYFQGNGVTTSGLISALIVMAVHFTWVFFDLFYILVRKFTSR